MKYVLESMSKDSYQVKESYNKYQCKDITEWEFIDYFYEMGWVINGDIILIIEGKQVVRTCNIIIDYDSISHFFKSRGYNEFKYKRSLGFAFGRLPDEENGKDWFGIIVCEVDEKGLYFKIIRRKNVGSFKTMFRKVD